jgi:hypothetical protein
VRGFPSSTLTQRKSGIFFHNVAAISLQPMQFFLNQLPQPACIVNNPGETPRIQVRMVSSGTTRLYQFKEFIAGILSRKLGGEKNPGKSNTAKSKGAEPSEALVRQRLRLRCKLVPGPSQESPIQGVRLIISCS